MKKHYETHVEDTDKLISVAGPVLDYKSWYERYRKLMEEQAQRKYGLYTPTSEGDDDLPSIPGMIARYSAKGLTNEEMSKNPVWKDLTGNGHDLQMKNFAWAGMSGVGGYKYNFLSNDWNADVNQLSVVLSHKIVIINKRTSIQLVKLIRNELENTINITLKITGLEANGSSFKIYDNVGSSHAQEYNKDGIYQINYTATEGANRIYFYVPGGNMGQLENPITIEQLPLYPGALVFDGVDDYGVCENFPILTKEKGYTVVALRQWITYNPNVISAIATNASDQSFNGAFTFENYNKGAEQTISYGATQISLQYSKSPFSWQTTSKYNGVNIANGNKDATNSLVLGRSYPQRNDFANFAIWELVFLDHDATEEELTKIKDYFVKTYPWLFPDQAWTVVGKTNEDEDRATIANITGNGNDLVLSNFGFAEGSGYGLYAVNFLDSIWVKNTGLTKISPSSFTIENTIESTQATVYINTSGKDIILPSFKVNITGLGNVVWKYHYIDDARDRQSIILQDGVNVLPTSYVSLSATSTWVGFGTITGVTDNITIEQIPEYEGYLVTDGVDDKIISSIFKMGNDWTVIGDWELINTGKNDNAGIVKFNSIIIYNYNNRTLINIKNGRNILIPDQNTINAVCSDGRIYSKDWKESIYNEETESTSKNLLTIGYSGNNYTKIAFRNLAIYPTVLSKEDCIKAYNYLQTLKAK
jgi:hypothetical protein